MNESSVLIYQIANLNFCVKSFNSGVNLQKGCAYTSVICFCNWCIKIVSG